MPNCRCNQVDSKRHCTRRKMKCVLTELLYLSIIDGQALTNFAASLVHVEPDPCRCHIVGCPRTLFSVE